MLAQRGQVFFLWLPTIMFVSLTRMQVSTAQISMKSPVLLEEFSLVFAKSITNDAAQFPLQEILIFHC